MNEAPHSNRTSHRSWRDWRRETLTRPLLAWYKKRIPPMSDTEREAIEAGTVWWDAALFTGNPDWTQLLSAPKTALSIEEQAFLAGPVEELCAKLDDWRIQHEWRDLPPEAWAFIKANKFFGMIVPKRYGGLGFSAQAHSAVVSKLATRSIAGAVTVMVPNSLGPAELLLHYGTEAQKDHYLPRLAHGTDIPCFALTGPEAGSDASAMPDVGIVCKGMYEGREILGLSATWEKRYITLGPVATLMGLALRVQDPDHLLSDVEDRGITVALIPTDLPGISIGRRHLPVNQAFMNGPNSGKDVFIPMDMLIGGQERIGQGWRMLVECLAAGRGISLPALSAGGVKLAARTTGAYSRVRKQFGVSIGKFEGVQEALARIGGYAYLVESMRRLTAVAVDMGEKPSVLSAIAKFHATEMMRKVINDALDVHGGKAIIEGPRNYLSNVYHALPVSITVEGANILTRSLIIFGQGAIRCHPYLYREMLAARDPDPEKSLTEFDDLIWRHAAHIAGTKLRAFFHNLTGGCFVRAPRVGAASGIYRQLGRASASFAFVAEVAMILLGGALKRREALSARLGDALSHMYILSAALKRFEDDRRPDADLPFLQWSAQHCLYEIQLALNGVLANFPYPPLGALMRVIVFPLGRRRQPPGDKLTARVADLLLTPSTARDRLTAGIYLGPADEPIGELDAALIAVTEADEIAQRLKRAAHKEPTAAEKEVLDRAAELTHKVIAVDDFAPEAISPNRVTSRVPGNSAP
jgi:acyl-CoA dehydrogenase